MVSLHQLNAENNGLLLLFKSVFRHLNCFLPSVVTDVKDRNGLNIEKFGPFFSRFDTKIAITVSSP